MSTSNHERPHRGFRWQLPKKVNCRTASTSRLQLCLAGDKSLLGVNSVRSVSKSARFIALTIHSSLNDNQPADYKSLRNWLPTTVWTSSSGNADRNTGSFRSPKPAADCGERGLSLVSASRVAVPRPASADFKTSWLDENVPCFKTRIAENRDIVLQSTFTSKACCRAIQVISTAEVEGKGAHLQR